METFSAIPSDSPSPLEKSLDAVAQVRSKPRGTQELVPQTNLLGFVPLERFGQLVLGLWRNRNPITRGFSQSTPSQNPTAPMMQDSVQP